MGAQSNFPIIASNMNFNSSTVKNAGQKVSSNVWNNAYANVRVPLTGKWYWEYITDNYVYAWGGIGRPNYGGSNQHNVDFSFVQGGEYRYNGTNQANTSSIGTGDIVGVYVNDGVIKVYINNSLDHTYSQNLSVIGSEELYPCFTGSSNVTVNFGQDSSFLGVKTAQGNTDANGIGDFYYTPPDSSLSLASVNAPTSTGIDPVETDDDIPTKQFNTVLYAGNNGAQSVTGVGFKPDLVWLKAKDGTQHHALFDSSRGVLKRLGSSRTNVEDTDSTFLSSFDTDGFSWSSGGDNTQNDNSYDYVGWCWRANGGTTSTNTSGTITSTVQANQAAGFSIVLYTGESATRTVGHGLSAVPNFIIFKSRGGTRHWGVYHTDTVLNMLTVNRSNAADTGAATAFGGSTSTLPTSSVFTIGDSSETGKSENYVAYVWHNVDGYSRFGSYEGNGNANGPFIHLGFRPRMLFIKRTDSAANWQVRDTARRTFNVHDVTLNWDSNTTETQNSNHNMDILSNGFKLRTTLGDYNASGGDYVYGAWGDVPFKYGNTHING